MVLSGLHYLVLMGDVNRTKELDPCEWSVLQAPPSRRYEAPVVLLTGEVDLAYMGGLASIRMFVCLW